MAENSYVLDLSESWREALEFERALTVDEQGYEIFAGLTRQESEFLAKHRQRGIQNRGAQADRARARDLQTRNDLARGHGILGAHAAISGAQRKR